MRALLLLAVAFTAVCAQNSYVVISPSKIRANMDLSLSVNILKATGDVTVVASILRGTTEVAKGTKVFQAGTPSTIDIKLPADLPSSSYTLKVTGSGGLTFEKSQSLTYNSKEASLFIQINKAIFKPGDTVNFRTFGIYSDLKSYNAPMDISIFDSASNKIKQWLQVKPDNGVITQELTLSTQPVLGDWKITVEAGRTKEEKVFTVAEYVLPKFEVDVIMPSFALTTDTDITFTVKSKYTYGKPVKGTADVLVQLHYSSNTFDYSKDLPVTTIHVPIDGEAKVSVPLAQVLAITKQLNEHILVVTANVTESLTGNQMSGNGTVTMYDKAVKLEFPESNAKTFKPGLQYIGYLKVTQPDGLPVNSGVEQVKISIKVTAELPGVTPTPYYWYVNPTENRDLPGQSLSIPSNGLVAIQVDVPADAKDVHITASYQGISRELTLGKSHSPSNSYIQLTLKSAGAIKAGDNIIFEAKGTENLTSLVYQILSRGVIVKAGSIDANNEPIHQFSIPSDASMAPNARIVVYYVRKDGEIVTDSISFDIAGVFKNKVSIDLDKVDVEPGNQVTVTVKADPQSTAHLLAIDQSVLLLKSGNDVTADDVNADLKEYDTIADKTTSIFRGGFDCPMCKRKKRMIWWPYTISYGGSDAQQIFENAGVVTLTDCTVFHYQEPIRHPIYFLSAAMGGLPNAGNLQVAENVLPTITKDSLQEPARVRSNFVETWLWNDVTVG